MTSSRTSFRISLRVGNPARRQSSNLSRRGRETPAWPRYLTSATDVGDDDDDDGDDVHDNDDEGDDDVDDKMAVVIRSLKLSII